MFPIYCRVCNFFEYIKEVLKQVRVTLRRAVVLHHRNRHLVSSNSKFDELKELHSVRIDKKCTNFLQRLEFFLKCKRGLEESKAQFTQN